MALDFPVVPINTEAKVFALNDLHDAIKNLSIHQSTAGGGAGGMSEGDKKRQEAEQYRKILAELERRNAFGDQAQPSAAPQPEGDLTQPSSTTFGMSGLQFQEAGGGGTPGETNAPIELQFQ